MKLAHLKLKRRKMDNLDHLIVEGPEELVFAMEKACEMLDSPKVQSRPLTDMGIRNVAFVTTDRKLVTFVSNERRTSAIIQARK